MREFTDSRNIEWRVWAVTPGDMHPLTRDESYMGGLYNGWLAFESYREKRRLEAPYPADWESFTIIQLETLCASAVLVQQRRAASPSGKHRAIKAIQLESDAESKVTNRASFMSPAGREWVVRIHECLDHDSNELKVLRFTSGDIVVELKKWPANWREASTIDFALLMLDAEPPRRRKKGEGPQRRQDDRPI